MHTAPSILSKCIAGITTCTLIAVAGCAGADGDVAVDPTIDSIDTAATTPTCPSATTAKAAQQKATAIVKYMLGGASPFPTSMMDPHYGECVGVSTNVNNIRNFVANGMCTLNPPTGTTTVCGLTAANYTLKCGGSAAHDYMVAATGYMDACFATPGTAYFFFPGQQDNFTMYMDPEPARLTQALTGTTGSTAAAKYVNSQVATTVLKWPATLTGGGSNPPVGGTPCNPLDLASGADTVHLIQNGVNGLKKCY